MKGIKFVISSMLLLFSLGVVAQNQYSITGTIVESETKEKLESVTVRILSEKDSSELTGTVTNKNGVFFLNVNRRANYILSASFLGYNTIYKPFTASGNAAINVGTIEMTEDAIELGEAIVMGKKPEVIVKGDTLEYDAASYKTTENAALEELLKKLPGAEVDDDGKITINGKEIKKILVEGKEFFSDDPTVASKNLPAEMIDKLQVVDRRSEMARMTGFDDGEEETVINLTIRPGMKTGTLGNFAAGGGRDLAGDKDNRYEVGGLLNYMKNQTRYSLLLKGNNTNDVGASDLGASQFGGGRGFGGFSGGITKAESVAFNMNTELSSTFSLNTDIMYNARKQTSNTITEETTNSLSESYLDRSRSGGQYYSENFITRMRMEWKPNEKHTLIFTPNLRYNTSERFSNSISSRLDGMNMDSLTHTTRKSYNSGEGISAGGTLEFSRKFDKPGRVLSFKVEGSISDDESDGISDQYYRYFNRGIIPVDSLSDQRTLIDSKSSSISGYFSYVEPIGNNNFLQFTYRATTGDTENINSTYQMRGYDESLWGGQPIDTAVLVGRSSRSTVRYTFQQRYSLKFMGVREKYRYTVGLNVDPSSSINKTLQPSENLYLPVLFDDRLPNIIGDTLISRIAQDVTNFSPEIDFTYQFSQRTRLRINYDGRTSQPSANQLRDYTDYSDILNLTKGNPHLKPGYSNQLNVQFNKFIPETQFTYNMNLSGNYSINDIAGVTTMDKGVRTTTYENVNGNWGSSLRGGFSTPLKNKKFTINTIVNTSLSNRKSFVNGEENTQFSQNFGGMFRANYRSSLFDLGANTRASYGKTEYTVQSRDDQETFNWSLGGSTAVYLPYNITVESDLNWTNRTGYGEGFDISETMWNASVMKQLFNKKYGIGTLKLKIYDILQDRNSINAGPTTNGFRSSMSTTIPSFFMCTFIYKFSAFPGGGGSERDFRGGDGERRGPGGPGGPGGGGRPNRGGGGGGFGGGGF